MSIVLALTDEQAKVVCDVLLAEFEHLQEDDHEGAADATIQVLDQVTNKLADLMSSPGAEHQS